MSKDSEIRKAIEKEFKPKKSFDEFCEEHNLVFKEEQPKRKAFSLEWIKAVLASAVCVAAIVLMLIPFANNIPVVPPIKYYGEDEVTLINSTYEELVENVFLPSGFEDAEYSRILQVRAKEDDSLFLGYFLEQIIYGFYNEDKSIVFELEMIIRSYEGYLFASYNFFDDLKVTYKEVYQYGISDLINEQKAYIKFAENDFEYFITLKEYKSLTEINKDNVELFLEHLI